MTNFSKICVSVLPEEFIITVVMLFMFKEISPSATLGAGSSAVR